MKAHKMLDMNIIDSNGNSVGKVGNIDINKDNGSITGIEVEERKGILSNQEIVSFNDVDSISDKIMLKNMKD
ncbi:PRC-barrel domain protein [Methanobrevibacter cuticularis]|uniref:PRC-barrel domain protein n=1 Tax=Methanobrevibacter cuticularis TaxID=47311 RepID=A0A166CLK4_9EURY|nr:PRC-barrel domain-containing protein [Methanobrevibacter cuticularis]KZX14638.1 PRC-barrel domain protein [Methanobrevibacter cuticularis]